MTSLGNPMRYHIKQAEASKSLASTRLAWSTTKNFFQRSHYKRPAVDKSLQHQEILISFNHYFPRNFVESRLEPGVAERECFAKKHELFSLLWMNGCSTAPVLATFIFLASEMQGKEEKQRIDRTRVLFNAAAVSRFWMLTERGWFSCFLCKLSIGCFLLKEKILQTRAQGTVGFT